MNENGEAPRRLRRAEAVLARRTGRLMVVLERCADEHNRHAVLRTAEAPKYQLQRDLSVYATAYAEAMKNLEIAEFSFKTATPFWQTIDLPIPPLKPKGASKKRALLMGGLLGGLLGVGFVVGRKVIRTAMKNER